MPVQISDIARYPDFGPTVADRVWSAWWRPKGYSLDIIMVWMRAHFAGAPLPFCLVAHEGETFIGTASLVASDMQECLDLSPWVAAVWVDPDHRNRGVGTALIREAVDRARQRGFERVHLGADADRRRFLEGIGWELMGRGIGVRKLDVFRRSTDSRAGEGDAIS